jgi:sulfate transport system permease protein
MRAPLPQRPSTGAWLLIALALGWLGLAIIVPLASIFTEALRQGLGAYLAAFQDPDAIAAIKLTLEIAAISVPMNAVFGLAAAWTVTKFEFRGKTFLLSLIDIPFSMSPVISGLVWVLLFGANGWFGPQLDAMGIKVIFNFTGILLATVLVTLPFVARELIPLMQSQGTDEELAAITLGAGAFSTFFRVTLPNISWALLYGVLLCNARAMGEFGAVSVVSGHIRGVTDTMPLHVEALYNDNDFVGAFAVASLLAGLALVTLVFKTWLEWRFSGELAHGARASPEARGGRATTRIR